MKSVLTLLFFFAFCAANAQVVGVQLGIEHMFPAHYRPIVVNSPVLGLNLDQRLGRKLGFSASALYIRRSYVVNMEDYGPDYIFESYFRDHTTRTQAIAFPISVTYNLSRPRNTKWRIPLLVGLTYERSLTNVESVFHGEWNMGNEVYTVRNEKNYNVFSPHLGMEVRRAFSGAGWITLGGNATPAFDYGFMYPRLGTVNLYLKCGFDLKAKR